MPDRHAKTTDGQLSSGTNSQTLEVSVVMPCLNESETLQACIQEARKAIEDAGISGEVVIADNGSTDGSQAIAESAGARVVNIPQRGYGSALLGGIMAAKGQYILMGDADGSYNFGELPRFVEKLRGGAELVMGCRLPKGGGTIMPGAMPWKHRWIGNPVLSGLGRIFFRSPVDDFHCGLRAFRKDAIVGLDLHCTGMEFASEMVVKSTFAQLEIDQVPITLRPDGRSKAPHLQSWRDGWRHLRFMLLHSPKWLFLFPGALLTLVSLLGFVTLVWGPVKIGGLNFSINTLLVSAIGMLVGFQTLFFAVYTKVVAVQQGVLNPDARVKKLLSMPLVEWGLLAGLGLVLAGVAGLIGAVLYWQAAGFGNLPTEQSLRIVIPAVTSIAMGVQWMFSGFALAVLGLKVK
ncbi:MAG TPA: glycosyltransferase family 2 protein [Gammaproteobacteria bacterium]|nr:glycosyltransferase family 2 protein [Gammaproteobacteria bacterium]